MADTIEIVQGTATVVEVAGPTGPQGPAGASQADVLTQPGDMLYRSTVAARLPIGTAGQILKVNAGATAPEWGAAPASGVSSVAGRTGDVTLAKADVGLGNVDNTSDANKPVSTATQTALDAKAATSDSRLTDTREWSADTISQAEAEAGTATTRRAFTALRVFQAIAAWWAGSSAKTKLDGIATGATANATDAQLRDRSTHTGTQAAGTITGLATVATSASAADLSTGTLSDARLSANVALAGADVSFDDLKANTLVLPASGAPAIVVNSVSGQITASQVTLSSKLQMNSGSVVQVPSGAELELGGNFRDATTTSKKLALDLSGISADTTRTLTVPNASGTIALAGTITTSGLTQATARILGRTTASTGAVEELSASDVRSFLNVADGAEVNVNADWNASSGDAQILNKPTLGTAAAAATTDFAQASHTHAASAITSGTFDNARINFAAPAAIGNTTPAAGTFTTLTANNGTLTASAPVLDLAQTWNNAAVAFTGMRIDCTATANSTSSSYFSIARSGTTHFEIVAANANIPQINIGGSGFTTRLRGRTSAGVGLNFDAVVGVGGSLQFGVGSTSGAGDVFLLRDAAADTLALQRTTNPQTFRLYNTYTDASNHERGFMRWSSNVLQIGTEKAGTGSARALEFQTDGVTRMGISTGGTVGFGQQTGQSTALIGWSGNCFMRPINASAGVLTLLNAALDGFDRLQFGGTTSSFPALKRSSTALQVRLADDSAYSVLDAQLRSQGTAPATSGAAGTAGDIRYDADYIYVCTAASTWKRAAIATW